VDSETRSEHGDHGDHGFVFPQIAAATVDRHGVVTEWSESAERLLGRPARDVLGHRFADLLASEHGEVPAGQVRLRPADGHDVAADLYPIPLNGGDRTLLLFAPARKVGEWGYGVSLFEAMLAQREFGLVVHRPDLRVTTTNMDSELFGGSGLEPGERLLEVLATSDAQDVEQILHSVLYGGGKSSTSSEQLIRSPRAPGRDWYLSWRALRMQDAQGRPIGVAALIDDVTEQAQARKHRDLMQRAAGRIGLSLELFSTAQELADTVVEGFGDLSTVELSEAVLLGDEPSFVRGGETALVRAAVATAAGPWPAGLLGPKQRYPTLPTSTDLDQIQQGDAVRLTREQVVRDLGGGELADLFVPAAAHSAAVAPLWARGLLLGTVTVWRTAEAAAFEDADIDLLTEVASRAALGIDNARRYTRERSAAIALQRSLLPQANVTTSAAEAAGSYRPAGGGDGVCGDWFDTIALSSLRTACVVGDVVGHGLSAAATMGRLRTAVQAFADLELDPGEVLARLDDLVRRLASNAPPDQADIMGASCLYAVYDATTGECTAASAGQPPPVMCHSDGSTEVIDLEPGPVLGAGGAPYQSMTFKVPPGSVIAFYTDGMFGLECCDDAQGVAEQLAARYQDRLPLAEIGRTMLEQSGGRPPRDDCALLLVRPTPAEPGDVVGWQLEPQPEAVAQARELVARQLHEWDHDELGFTTELVISELVTNAIRYGTGRVEVRLIRDHNRVLTCEVADASNTQPRLRRAADTDEGGRGLFIVAQCTTRWGCRYRAEGKTIWTELPLTT
jgi:serine phosphatase RsbU (regulator of sigma subunit)/PAS domain-containing protein/anti-sigma regulatory factor (Ser/Thr protein kinase)